MGNKVSGYTQLKKRRRTSSIMKVFKKVWSDLVIT